MRLLVTILFGMMAVETASLAAEPVMPIGQLLVSPSSVHRKVFKLEGVVKNAAAYSGSEFRTNQPLCGADFDLEDYSGTIAVLYHVRCQSGGQKAFVVDDGMHLVIDGYMEAPPDVQRYSNGKDFGVRFVALSVASLRR